jgi:hypothetical protein
LAPGAGVSATGRAPPGGVPGAASVGGVLGIIVSWRDST